LAGLLAGLTLLALTLLAGLLTLLARLAALLALLTGLAALLALVLLIHVVSHEVSSLMLMLGFLGPRQHNECRERFVHSRVLNVCVADQALRRRVVVRLLFGESPLALHREDVPGGCHRQKLLAFFLRSRLARQGAAFAGMLAVIFGLFHCLADIRDKNVAAFGRK